MTDYMVDLPELTRPAQIVRIPPEIDVPITDRVRAVLDTQAMQRLKEISQLGLVSFVYPGAVHSRFEHSLGVYRLACLVLQHIAQTQPELVSALPTSEVKVFLLAALLHDVGHWPYCHPIEDMCLPETPTHESAARRWIQDGQLAEVIGEQWDVSPGEVADFLSAGSQNQARRLLQKILNGPVDIDKMDYLQRDSLHAGVPYGRNFDVSRLLSSFRFGKSSDMSITSKGKTAAEMMVFSRYVMFSEVYWHHSVRSATAMLQRIVFRLRDALPCSTWFDYSDADFQSSLMCAAEEKPGLSRLSRSLFGRQRQLYKRFSEHSYWAAPEVHSALAHRPFEALVRCAELVSRRLAKKFNVEIGPDDLLIDAPPVKLEIQFRLDVQSSGSLQSLADVSPVVRTLATEQFDQFVKQVRVFVAPPLRHQLSLEPHQWTDLLIQCADQTQ